MKLLKRMETFGYLFLALGALVTIGGGYLLSKNTDKVNLDRIEDLKAEIGRKEKDLSAKTEELSKKTEIIRGLNEKIDSNVVAMGDIVSDISGLTKEIEVSSSYLRNEVEEKKLEWNLVKYSAQFHLNYNDSDLTRLEQIFNRKEFSFEVRFWQNDNNGREIGVFTAVIKGNWTFQYPFDATIPMTPNLFLITTGSLELSINQAKMVFKDQIRESFKKNRNLNFRIVDESLFNLRGIKGKFGLYSIDNGNINWAKENNFTENHYFEGYFVGNFE